jgi:hypothetical protein
MMIVTIYSLFCDDIKLLFYEKDADYTFMILTSIALAFFLIELILGVIGKDGYLNSFYFWLDLISTLSLVTDIDPIWNLIVGDAEKSKEA